MDLFRIPVLGSAPKLIFPMLELDFGSVCLVVLLDLFPKFEIEFESMCWEWDKCYFMCWE